MIKKFLSLLLMICCICAGLSACNTPAGADRALVESTNEISWDNGEDTDCSYTYIKVKGTNSISVLDKGGVLIATVKNTTVTGDTHIIAYRMDGVKDAVTIALPQTIINDIFMLKSNENKKFECSVQYEDFYMCAELCSNSPVIFDPAGSISINGSVSKFSMNVTANSSKMLSGWHTITIEGKEGQSPRIAMLNGKYEISGENFKNIKVCAEGVDRNTSIRLKQYTGIITLSEGGGFQTMPFGK